MKEIAHITLSHPDKLYYPEANISKQDLAEYYHQNSKLILPHFINRPLSVYRCPEGVDHSCFFQKHIETLPDAVSSVHIKEKHTNGKYIVAKDESSVIALVQNGSLEFHTWGSKADNIEHPESLPADHISSSMRRLKVAVKINFLLEHLCFPVSASSYNRVNILM